MTQDERWRMMKYYPDKMTAEQVRRFGEDVLNIVSQIPLILLRWLDGRVIPEWWGAR